MPQLDTSTWPIIILSMILTLFIMLQLKTLKLVFPLNPAPKNTTTQKYNNPWEMKWTKIYSPLSLPLQL
uniref:ATP synthase complex subunit 8 n=1 Tax=Daubentonia madagascariensis TaxID=31869 RepID=A0A0A7DFJ2_DAUMA|nr:ATP synthase F0 subunit 8 [Daubentonia madagascariensis]AII98665.1 ATP synthase F0 subunit 8 [Daubentonia madagascariensis]AII98678.1 ATP synthase F0 subunit 8 [Daubentonia madagascariensis]AII98691.1 ATP synthase F0 subunit 8 [Daubentonia madagascariensis]